MKILVLNSSLKGKKSNTYHIANAFLNGMKTELGENASIETVEANLIIWSFPLYYYDTAQHRNLQVQCLEMLTGCHGMFRLWRVVDGRI